jgi:hypothetical protein
MRNFSYDSAFYYNEQIQKLLQDDLQDHLSKDKQFLARPVIVLSYRESTLPGE